MFAAKKLAIVIENLKEGFAEPNQADYITALVSNAHLPLTLSIIGTAKAPNGKGWLSDPQHDMLLKFKSAFDGRPELADFAIQGYHNDGQWIDYWNRDIQGFDRKPNSTKNGPNITSELSKACDKVREVFGRAPTTFIPPRHSYKDKAQVKPPEPWSVLHMANDEDEALLHLVTDKVDENEHLQSMSVDYPLHSSVAYLTNYGGTALPVGARTNGAQLELDKTCGVSEEIKQQVTHNISAQMTDIGFGVLVISPQDVSRSGLFSSACAGTDVSKVAEMRDFLSGLCHTHECVRLCEVGRGVCPPYSGFPAWPYNYMNIPLIIIKAVSLFFIAFSFLATFGNWIIVSSACKWAGCSKSATAQRGCGACGVVGIAIALVCNNVLMIYMLSYFVLSLFRGFDQLAIWAPLDALGRDTSFQLFAFIYVAPSLIIILLSMKSLIEWQRWFKNDGDWKSRLNPPDGQPLDDDNKLTKVVVVVPIYQEDERAFMRMVRSATFQDYAKDGRADLVELFIVFDGQEKFGKPLKRSIKAKKAIDLYLGKKNNLSSKYYSARDPETGVKVHVFCPEWGGKWSAQRNVWAKMCDVYRNETDKPILLFIDSDCAMKEDAVGIMARCMLEKRRGPAFAALAGHVKVEMTGGSCGDHGWNFWWKLQEADFIISQMMVRGGEEQLGGCSCLPGAFCMMAWDAFEREADTYFLDVDKNDYWEYSMVHVAEDRYLTLLLLLRNGKHTVGYCPFAEVTTECPGDIQTLIAQRRRWYLSAMVNDIPMLLTKKMWTKLTSLMVMRLWFLVSSCAPANTFQVGILAVVAMFMRDRSPDMSLLYLTVGPTFISMVIYSILCSRRGPILYYWVFQMFMPVFSMYVTMKAFNQWRKDERGWGGAREAGGPGATPAAAAAGQDAQQALMTPEEPPKAEEQPPVGSLGFRASFSQAQGSLSQRMSFAALDFTLHSLRYGASFREIEDHEGDDGGSDHSPDVEELVLEETRHAYQYEKEVVHELRADSKIPALEVIRFVASIHIVMFHYFKVVPDDANPVGFINPNVYSGYWVTWGGQWVQFFFILSGFLMTYTRLLRRQTKYESSYEVWKGSIQKMYPTFFLSILLTLWGNVRDIDLYWKTLPATLTLVFSWGWNQFCFPPSVVEGAGQHVSTPWKNYNEWVCCQNSNEPAWFLCVLMVYWMLFPHIYNVLHKASQLSVIMMMLVCWGFTLFWPYFLGIPSIEPLYYWGGPLATIQAYNPISHWYKFVYGMTLARIFVDIFCREKTEGGKLFISETVIKRAVETKLFAPVGWLCIVILFSTIEYDDFSFSPFFRPIAAQEFVLFVFFGLVILGCCFENDPITRLLIKMPFRLANDYNISYEIYILQGCVFSNLQLILTGVDACKPYPHGTTKDELEANQERYIFLQRVLFFPMLLIVSFFVMRYISGPIGGFLSQKKPAPKPRTPPPMQMETVVAPPVPAA